MELEVESLVIFIQILALYATGNMTEDDKKSVKPIVDRIAKMALGRLEKG